MQKANILLIFTDQMRGDALGVLDGSDVITPNLDRLSGEGITFTRCMSNSPLCVPARASLMTGQLPREHGVWSNAIGADETGPSHVRCIRDAGYRTAVIGKTHLWRDGTGMKPGRHVREMDWNLEAWGFQDRVEVNDPIGTAIAGCRYTDYLEEKGLLRQHRDYMLRWIKEAYRERDPKPWDQVPSPVPPGEDIDSFVGRSAVEWVESYREEQPFYLQVQFTGPHDPFDGPQRYRDLYDASRINPGIVDLPRPMSTAVASATVPERQQWRANYYANISLIDEWIGRILSALESRGMLDDTWILFNSDHGEMLGDHGLWSKANFYRQSVHVPCVLRPPGTRPLRNGPGWKSDALVEHVDLPVTIMDIAGASGLDGSLGQSLLPYIDLEADDPSASRGKDAVFSELFGMTTVITDEFKLTTRVSDGSSVQLLDLKKDPLELKNLSEDPAYTDTIEELIEAHLKPLEGRLDEHKFADFMESIRKMGQ